jgi:transmembrane protein TMEM131
VKSIKFSWVVLLMLAGATSVVFAQDTTPKKVEQSDNKGGQPPATTAPTSAPLTISPDKLEFPAQQLNSEGEAQTVRVTNATSSDVVIQKVLTGGDFKVEAPLPQTSLPPGASTVIAVSFTPKQEGNISGLLRIETDKGDVPDIPLSGATYQPLGGICSSRHSTERFGSFFGPVWLTGSQWWWCAGIG